MQNCQLCNEGNNLTNSSHSRHDFKKLKRHLKNVHGLKPLLSHCMLCHKVFESRAVYMHFFERHQDFCDDLYIDTFTVPLWDFLHISNWELFENKDITCKCNNYAVILKKLYMKERDELYNYWITQHKSIW